VKFKITVLIVFSAFYLLALTALSGPEVYFTPKRLADKIFFENLKSAEKSIYIASYSCYWDELMKNLAEKKGIELKVMVNNDLPGNILPAESAKISESSKLFHPKFVLIDGKILIVGSANFTHNSFHLHHNNFLYINDIKIADFFRRKFLLWWQEEDTDEIYVDDKFEIYFSPQNDCEAEIGKLISGAEVSVHFALFNFTSENLAKQLILRKLAGVKISGIIERSCVYPHSVFYSLRDFGCEIKKSNMAGFLHDKFFIIDEKTVITGSYNPTVSARENTECLIIIKDKKVAACFLKEWERLWAWKSME
jgi:phosphatidylserine/phosphatidylglycerophosphate/cardiolipin synthase-like enzyme